MKNYFAKRICSLLLTVIMILSSVPMGVFAQAIDFSEVNGGSDQSTTFLDETSTTVGETTTAADRTSTTAEETTTAVDETSTTVPEDEMSGPLYVKSSQDLEEAIASGESEIRIVTDFEIDRTFYITHSVTIYTTEAHTLKRAADFGGDIFVVGQSADGTVCEKQADLTVGLPSSDAENLLIIDGNKDAMTATVTGTVFFVCANGHVNLYKNLTVKNCNKVGNERTLEAVHGVSYPEYIGAAVGIIAKNASMDIYGGTYTDNSGKDTGKSSYGGAFYNFGNMNVYAGTFSNNSAFRAGAIYNYRVLNIYNAEISNNHASSVGGAIYMPASTGSFLYIGQEHNGAEGDVKFSSNSSSGNAGAIYASNKISVENTTFEGNKAVNGGAVHIKSGTYAYFDECIFDSNVAEAEEASTDCYGGAVNIIGAEAEFNDSQFLSNSSDDNAGAIYSSESQIIIFNGTFSKNSSDVGGALSVHSGSEIEINSTIGSENSAVSSGGFALVESSKMKLSDGNFSKNVSAAGGAFDLSAATETSLCDTVFEMNEATDGNGGAISVHNSSAVDMNNITGSENSSAKYGGFGYIYGSAVRLYNSKFDKNTAASGGAFNLNTSAATSIYNTSFEENAATDGNGGALDIYTTKTDVFLHSCNFTGNTSTNFGGAMRVTSETPLTMYNITATNNSAYQGGFMYETKAGSVVTVIGLTVSGNTAEGGPIIWGNTYNATLNISKNHYVDKDATAVPDDAYWTGAIANKLTVNYIDGEIPRYNDYGNEEPGGMWDATDVESADELQAALEKGEKEIRIIKSFKIDRTFYVTSDTVVFSTAHITLTRAADFGGDMFVIGQSADGTPCEEQADLTVGIPTSKTKNLLTIDGNENKMAAVVKGTVFFVCANGHVNLYENLTVKNCKKTDNERTFEAVHGVSYPDNIGAAVGIIAKNATMDIYGGLYTDNSGNDSGKSSYGGAFYNFGNMNVYGGTFSKNRAARAGAFYNYRVLNIYGADINNNHSVSSGGAIYMPASSSSFLNIGQDLDGVESKVVFTLNSSAGNAGAIYGNNVINVKNAIFNSNKADNGGAISSYSAVLTVEDSEFISNSVGVSGAAIYVSGKSSKEDVIELNLNSTIFTSNTATLNGGALYIKSAAAHIGECLFDSNSAKADTTNTRYGGGAAYITEAAVEFNGTEFTSNSSNYNGGAVLLNTVEDAVFRNISSDGDKASKNGGFLYATASSPKLYGGEVKNASAVSNGGAIAAENGSVTDIIKASFFANSASNGGAVFTNTGEGRTLVHSSTFTQNTASDGGAFKVSGGSLLEIYNTEAVKNSADYGGVAYISGEKSKAKLNLIKVSDNAASVAGPVVYSDTAKATLEINKSKYTDEKASGSLDENYWKSALAGNISVIESDEKTPGYAEYGNESYGYMWTATDASSADELETLLAEGVEYIRIVSDFELDRTFTVNNDTVIFSTKHHKLTRALAFDGVVFDIIGNGTDKAITLGIGNSTSETQNLLVIDGNADNMTAKGKNPIINVREGQKLELFDNVTFTSCSHAPLSVHGEITVNGGSFTGNKADDVSAVIVCYGKAEINGGNFNNNSSTKNGGVISNFGKMSINAGTFSSNSAIAGGVIYNEGSLEVKSGIFEKNTATDGAVISNNGTLDIFAAQFKSNTAAQNGGAIVSTKSVTVSGAEFTSNKSVNGGAIYIVSDQELGNTLTVNSATFLKNSASLGGAVFAEKTKVTITAEFKENKAKSGGAVYLAAGCDADFVSIKASGDSAKEDGGFLYFESSNVNFLESDIESAMADFNGGAVYVANRSKIGVDSSDFKNNSAKVNGGAIYLSGDTSAIRINGSAFSGNTALNNGGAIYKAEGSKLEIDSSNFESCSSINGGAVYASDGETIISNTTFNSDRADNNGGALAFENSAEVTLYSLTAKNNTAGNNGGFLYTEDTNITLTDSVFSSNTAEKSGGAVMFEGDTVAECSDCEFTGNKSKANGGAVSVETDRTKAVITRCKFTSNDAAKNGGAAYFSSGSIAEIFDINAANNSASYGAVMYITTPSTDVTLNGSIVSGNKAKTNGYIIYGNSSKAILRINKAKHIDKDKSGSLDSAYWSKAIAGTINVKESNATAPEFGNGAVDVSGAAELEKAINTNKKLIRIVADFDIDRTYYITSDITIFSDEPHTLRRSVNFGGDMFVVGETASGEKAYFGSRDVRLTVGNSLSDKENLLIIDGNKDNMKAQVNGSVFFISYGANVELYDNLTIINCFKQGNERSYKTDYKLSRPNRIGGSVAIIANGMLTVHGGNYKYNMVNEEDATTEEGRNSSIGGVFYNNSNLIIRGGNFEGNEAARGGIVYNYRIVKILAGTFKNNVGTKYSAIYYSPSSPPVHLLIGSSDKDGGQVLFKNNTSAYGPSIIYSSHYSAIVVYGNTSFKNNTVTKGNGGVISTTGTLTVKNSEFIGNKAMAGYGGAIYISRGNNDHITRLAHLEGCTFKENEAKYGGAVGMNSAAVAKYSKGVIVTVKDCRFENNIAKTAGGAIYANNLSDLTVDNSSFVKNSSKGEAGSMYLIGKSRIKLNNNVFDGNTSTSHGGALSIRSSYVDIKGGKFTGNKSVKNAGAIYISYSSNMNINSHLSVDGTNFKNNSAAAGGAFYATRRAIEENAILVNVKNSTFEENKSNGYGGAILLTGGIKTYFANVDFKKNNAATGGGAVQVGSKSLFELNKGSFAGNTSKNGGAITLSSSGTALMNNIQATGNSSTSNGGFLYSEGGILKLYNSTLKGNVGFSGGAMYLYTNAVNSIYNTEFNSNKSNVSSGGSTGNGAALFIYTGKAAETVIHSCAFTKNESSGSGGAMYVSGLSQVKLYNNTASNNKAKIGGFMYETKAGTVVDAVGLTVSGNTAENGGSIIWGNTDNAVLNIDKSKYTDKSVSKLDDNYWKTAIEGKLTVNDKTVSIVKYDPYAEKKEEVKPTTTKKPVSVEDVFTLGKKSSDADIDSYYNKLKKLDNSSNLMSRSTADYPNINGKTVTVDTFVYPTKGKTDNGIVGLGILLYQSLLYKKANPKEEVYINISSYRFSVQSAVNINRNSRYFGYMRNLVGKNYDEYGFVRLSYLLITAAKMGIHVTVIGQLDAYPISSSNPNFYEYFTQQLSDPCDPAYVKNGVIGDYLDFNFCYWTLDAKGGTDMMHTKMCTVSHYLDKNGVVRRNAVWSSSSNLDGVKSDGQNANWKLQTATVVTNHDEIYRTAVNYLQLIASLCGQEQVIEFQDIVNTRSTEQIALFNQGKADKIPDDEQIVYLGTPNDDVFELYFTPFGGSAVAWDEVHNPYCKYLREMYESEDYILFTWNAAEYSGGFVLGRQIEDMIIRSFHENKNVKNKIYSYMESFDASTFDDLIVGKDIGYKSFFEKPFGKVHNKDVQLSYVKDGQRYFVTLLNSLNLHSGSMCYQSNFMLVVKEKSCAENGVFSTIARYSTTGDIAAHSYGDIKTAKATKTKDGYTYRECIYCKKQIVYDKVHFAGDWIIKKEATTTENGIRYKKCTACGDIVQSEEISRKTLSVNISDIEGRVFSAKSDVSVDKTDVPLTIEAKIHIPENYADRAGVIVGNYSESGKRIINLEGDVNGKLKLYIKNGSKVFKHIFSKDVRSDNPVDIAVVFESGKAVLYVNGTKTESVKLSVSLPDKAENLKIGRDNRKGNTQYFKGKIYYVNLFSKARKSSLIEKDRLLVSPDAIGLIYSAYYKGEKTPETTKMSSQSFTAKKLYKLNKPLTSAPKTIEARIFLSTSVKGRGGVIFGNYNSSYKAPFNLEIYTGGRVRLYFKNGKKTVSHIFKTDIRTKSGAVDIAVTLSGKTAILYVNGVKKETAKLSAYAPSATKNFCIGGDNRNRNKQYFRGKIYSINVFSDVRNATEIKRDTIVVPASESKLMYSSYITADNNSAVIERATLTGQTFKKDVRYIIPGDLKATPHTIEATVQLSQSVKGRAGVIFGNYNGKNGNQLNVSVVENGRVQLYFKTGKSVVKHTFKTDIRTQKSAINLIITINGKKATLYINGNKKETATLSKTLPKVTENFCIGGDNRSGNSMYFRGKIYAVNIFSDVRTASEIKKDAKVVTDKAKSLLYSGYFCDEMCGITSAAKTHTSGSWKTGYAATSSESGVKYKKCTACREILQVTEIKKKGTSLSSVNYTVYNGRVFDADNGAVSLSKKIPGKAFTVETMIQLSPDYSDRAGTIIGNYDGLASDQFNIEIYSDGKPRIYYKVNGKAYNHVFSTDIRSEKKTHIAITVDGKNVALYVNGKHKETYTAKFVLSDVISNLKIGGDNREGGNLFAGKMYSMYLFDGVRSKKQISLDSTLVASTGPSPVYSVLYK